MVIRRYDNSLDLEPCRRIWREAGWLPDCPQGLQAMEDYFIGNQCTVAELEGQAEALAVAVPGTLRHLRERLPFLAVTSVVVGHAARKRGLGAAVTAQATARGAEDGCAVAALGIFEQGYYNRLGYGNGPCTRIVTFRPSDLPGKLPYPERPCRIGHADLDGIYGNIRTRMACHGQALLSKSFYDAELRWDGKAWGLGCRDQGGALTHHIWFSGTSGEHGPCRVGWLCYGSSSQLLELMALIRGLGDQIDLVIMEEPPHLQSQDLFKTPIRDSRMLHGGRTRVGMRTLSYTQLRILDLGTALKNTRIPWGEQRFNLTLTDPVTDFLPPGCSWKGCAGEYTVVLGPESSAEPGHTRGLPEMRADIGAFSRLWFGVRPPSVLAATDGIRAPEPLLQSLDGILPLPEPRFNCDF